MQRGFECPVCREVYDTKTRVPKYLVACGHGVCEPCIRSILSATPGPDITCPTCSTQCNIPDRQPDKLPNIYPILELLDSLCAECNQREHTWNTPGPDITCPKCRTQCNIPDRQPDKLPTNYPIQADGNTTSDIIQVPDYTKATYKAMYGTGLQSPWDICTDPVSGNVVITDNAQHKVLVLSDTLQLVHTFGTKGQGSGEYRRPWGVAVYDSNIYICDQWNRRIHVTDTQGTELYTFGTYGSGRHQYYCPCALSVDKRGLLYVCDSSYKRIKVTDRRGGYVWEFGQDVFGTNERLWFIAISTDDKVAVSTNLGNIYMFTTNGQYIKTIQGKTPPHNINARGVCFDGHGHLLVSDYNEGRVAVMSESGEVECFIGTQGTGPGQLRGPWGVSVTREGGVIVCDMGNNRIQLFNVPQT